MGACWPRGVSAVFFLILKSSPGFSPSQHSGLPGSEARSIHSPTHQFNLVWDPTAVRFPQAQLRWGLALREAFARVSLPPPVISCDLVSW